MSKYYWVGYLLRIFLSGALLIGVYSETGIWTMIFCLLVVIKAERDLFIELTARKIATANRSK